MLLSLALATALAAEPPPRVAYPKRGVAIGLGLGNAQVLGRFRVKRLMFEPQVAAGVWYGFGFDGVRNTTGIYSSLGPSSGTTWSTLTSAVTDVGLDLRGLLFLSPRWEVGVFGGPHWRASWSSQAEVVDSEETGERRTSFANALTLRAGAGFAYRAAPWTSIGVDLSSDVLGVGVSPSRVIGRPKVDDDAFEPAVAFASSVGFRVLWSIWLDRPRVPVTTPEGRRGRGDAGDGD